MEPASDPFGGNRTPGREQAVQAAARTKLLPHLKDR